MTLPHRIIILISSFELIVRIQNFQKIFQKICQKMFSNCFFDFEAKCPTTTSLLNEISFEDFNYPQNYLQESVNWNPCTPPVLNYNTSSTTCSSAEDYFSTQSSDDDYLLTPVNNGISSNMTKISNFTAKDAEEINIFANSEISEIIEDSDEEESTEQEFETEKSAFGLTCLWIDCKSNFSNQSQLVHHIERVHVEGRREDFSCFWLGCPRRNRPFNARYKLLIHMRVHSGHKPNKCTFHTCQKSFSRLENLKIHQRSHTGERPYNCPFKGCPKAFSNSSDRAKHQRTHFDTKPYACLSPGCGKKYTDPSSLRKHAKIHFLISTPGQMSHLNPVKRTRRRFISVSDSDSDIGQDLIKDTLTKTTPESDKMTENANPTTTTTSTVEENANLESNTSIDCYTLGLVETINENFNTNPSCSLIDDWMSLNYNYNFDFNMELVGTNCENYI